MKIITRKFEVSTAPTAMVYLSDLEEFFDGYHISNEMYNAIYTYDKTTNPLHAAIKNNVDTEIIVYLADRAQQAQVPKFMSIKCSGGRTPLMAAIVEYIKYCKDRTYPDVLKNSYNTVMSLLTYCDHESLMIQDNGGLTALHFACAIPTKQLQCKKLIYAIQEKALEAWAVKDNRNRVPFQLLNENDEIYDYCLELSAAAIHIIYERVQLLMKEQHEAARNMFDTITNKEISGVTDIISEFAGFKKQVAGSKNVGSRKKMTKKKVV